MLEQFRMNWVQRIAIALLMMALASLFWGWISVQANPADDDDGEKAVVYGIVESMPEAGLIGSWVVDDVTYEASGSTEFEQNDGSLAVGSCVKVTYLVGTSPLAATEIKAKECGDNDDDGNAGDDDGNAGNDDGNAGDDDGNAGDDDGNESDDGEKAKVSGSIETMPSSGLIGSWVVDGVTYEANASTEFEQDDGPFVVGACVKIKYLVGSTPLAATEIETKNCNSNGDDDENSGGTVTMPDEGEIKGNIDSMPADGGMGSWIVNGVTYEVNGGTELEQGHGLFEVGKCVKVHFKMTGGALVAEELKTEKDHKCSNGGERPEGEMYGVIQNFPADLTGTWNVGGMTFVADTNTEFNQRRGAFEVGAIVEVKFYIGDDGLNHAAEIETKFADDDDDGGDGDGKPTGAKGHAYGVIDSLPAALVGTWTIGGVDYATTNETEFEQEDNQFAPGVTVKVKYYVDADGTRIAKEIEATEENGGVKSEDHFKFYGSINQMPASGFVGDWSVNNLAFVADETAKFKEDHGLFAIGAYVEVEYSIVGGKNTIHEIETHIPPGAGDNDNVGTIESINGGVTSASLQNNASWVIGGVQYTVSSATDLNDLGRDLVVGTTVKVNSYTTDGGSEVATQISTLLLDKKIFLPLTLHQ